MPPKKRPRGYRNELSRSVFEMVMKLIRDTIGSTGRYLDVMRPKRDIKTLKRLSITAPPIKYGRRHYSNWTGIPWHQDTVRLSLIHI